jgi:hypothetical protein
MLAAQFNSDRFKGIGVYEAIADPAGNYSRPKPIYINIYINLSFMSPCVVKIF